MTLEWQPYLGASGLPTLPLSPVGRRALSAGPSFSSPEPPPPTPLSLLGPFQSQPFSSPEEVSLLCPGRQDPLHYFHIPLTTPHTRNSSSCCSLCLPLCTLHKKRGNQNKQLPFPPEQISFCQFALCTVILLLREVILVRSFPHLYHESPGQPERGGFTCSQILADALPFYFTKWGPPDGPPIPHDYHSHLSLLCGVLPLSVPSS